MDKSFNDQELSDIMKEIEALEEEFKTDQDMGEEEMTSTLEVSPSPEMTQEATVTPIKEVVTPFVSPVVAATPVYEAPITAAATPKASVGHGTSMSFKVQGDLNLDLAFDVGGKSITLCVSESGLNIQIDGGMTFTVPLNSNNQASKKAA